MENEEFDLKVQLTNEYLRTGGVEEIPDPYLLQDIIDFNPSNPNSVTPRLKAFMNLILSNHLKAPYYSQDVISEYKSFLQKSFCFDQIEINTEEQFDSIYNNLKNKSDFLFRGQREAKWRLYSNLQRNWILNKLYNQEESYKNFLEKLVNNGKVEYASAIQEILNEFHIDTINSISVLGYLQHHGCPTPLLDWTYKFQNALYFGLDGCTPNDDPTEIGDYFSIYCIDEKSMGAGGMRQILNESLDEIGEQYLEKSISVVAENDEQRLEMMEHFKGRKFFDDGRIPGSGLISYITQIPNLTQFPIEFFSDKDAKSGIIFSLNNSKNILNQKGVFTWNSDSCKPLEVVGHEQFFESEPNTKPNDYRFCYCYNLNKNLANYIINKLEEDGIDTDYIYPTKEINTWDVYIKSQSANS